MLDLSPSKASHSSHAVFSASALMRRRVLSSICRCRASAVASSVLRLNRSRSWSLFSLQPPRKQVSQLSALAYAAQKAGMRPQPPLAQPCLATTLSQQQTLRCVAG